MERKSFVKTMKNWAENPERGEVEIKVKFKKGHIFFRNKFQYKGRWKGSERLPRWMLRVFREGAMIKRRNDGQFKRIVECEFPRFKEGCTIFFTLSHFLTQIHPF